MTSAERLAKPISSKSRLAKCDPSRKRPRQTESQQTRLANEYKRELSEGDATISHVRLSLADYMATYHESRKGVVATGTYDREETILRKAKDLFGVVELSGVDAA